ncbi:M14 family metallopeptidase [Actinocorallia sp. A-T 12471]|uniref:M14 family metallopeptidase n=1 Tax=Actinocorallia sp. A-T 12471 TaxID=3089813 RepID=UPI0029CB7B87|nr:M14 family zinc carboxypeptidase [Actinocorallia sp. A-T 12471]MDX6739168.1 M14 family zinc carboxypeptidase [Actinocorallia sp. A-T 12471]
MRRTLISACAAVVVGASAVVAVTAPATAAPDPGADRIQVFTGKITPEQLQSLRALGLDHEDIALGAQADGRIEVEVVMSALKGAALAAKGVPIAPKPVAKAKAAAAGDGVYRPYSGAGGIRAELLAAETKYPDIADAVDLGKSVNGKPITAVRVTKGARKQPLKSSRPSVVFQGTQHAREWITTENVRRQLQYFLAQYGKNAEITKLVDTTDLWFLPVVNVDGYDHTFTEGNRLWRKNLRDNDRDGVVTTLDGVDINRNFPHKWGWDNEGSSPAIDSETFRGTRPASEPETKAQNDFVKKIRPKYVINYHSAAELLLYGNGWQQQTPTPDDRIFEALLGDDAHPAVPGYDPDLGAELYITNGDTDGHFTNAYGALTMTPEMSTCETASEVDPNDPWDPAACESVFNFPDDEGLIQQEFTKNLPLAIATAKSAHDPDDPVSVVGRTAPDLVIDPFPVSHGTSQPVAVEAKRALTKLRLNYRINGGPVKQANAKEWKGGERYGDENAIYYAEYRATVKAKPKDKVEAWYTAKKGGKDVSSAKFTYTVATDIGGKVLVLAAEDVTGISPVQGVTSARYAGSYEAAVKAAGYTSDVYDQDAHNASPHPLGVLAHYDAVIWETGDDIIPRAQGQVPGTASKKALATQLAVRDYLNEGGKLLYTGKYAGFAEGANGAYFYEPDAADPECTVPDDPPCLPLVNDFLQYYLGTYTYVSGTGGDETGAPYPVKGGSGRFKGFAGVLNGGDSPGNQDHAASLLTTSSFLPPRDFPQFAGAAALGWDRPGPGPFDPRTGANYVYSQNADVSYKRLTRTIDLTGKADGTLSFQTSFDVEADWDQFFVEAHTVGADDWTTLPEAGGATSQETGESCAAGWRVLHPHLNHYQGADCSPTGTTGAWHSASGQSGGWHEWTFDLSAYAGKQVEVSISYVSDWGYQGIGVFVDDAKVTSGGATLAETSFEDGLGGWTVSGPPEGSAAAANDWIRTALAFEEGAGVATKDTVYLGFGLEGLNSAASRADLVKRSLRHLLH